MKNYKVILLVLIPCIIVLYLNIFTNKNVNHNNHNNKLTDIGYNALVSFKLQRENDKSYCWFCMKGINLHCCNSLNNSSWFGIFIENREKQWFTLIFNAQNLSAEFDSRIRYNGSLFSLFRISENNRLLINVPDGGWIKVQIEDYSDIVKWRGFGQTLLVNHINIHN